MDFENILSLPVSQKIGQLFFIGLPSTQIDASTRRLLDEISPGGVCLFARNIREAEQTRTLLDDIRANLPVEPFLSIDQEGGLVDRLRRIMTPMPAADAVRTIEDAGRFAELTAETLRIFGFNMNFAPVIDVIDNKRGRFSNGLYSRTFAQTAEETVEFAESYLSNLQQAGCLGCLKHFPGLGAAEVDSHESLPAVFLTETELFDIDLFPYRELMKTQDIYAVMVAHASFPRLELQETDQNGKLLPSSLSFNFITKLLREKLGFKNLVLTDDLEMGAILKSYGIGEACKKALLAGEDMLTICNSTDAIREGHAAILSAFDNGEITEARIDESLRRIAFVKNRMSEPLPFDISRLEALSGEIAEFNKKLNYNYGG